MKTLALSLFSLAFFVSACSDEKLSLVGTDLAVSADLASLPDLSLMGDFAGVACGTNTCAGGNSICCITPTGGTSFTSTCEAPSACVDGGAIAACDGPEDCGGAACCATVDILGNLMSRGDGGARATGGSAMCTNDCAAGLNLDNQFQTRLCHQSADCQGLTGTLFFGPEPFDKCCTSGMLTEYACVPSTAVALARLKCL
jgi:hypothetical protein